MPSRLTSSALSSTGARDRAKATVSPSPVADRVAGMFWTRAATLATEAASFAAARALAAAAAASSVTLLTAPSMSVRVPLAGPATGSPSSSNASTREARSARDGSAPGSGSASWSAIRKDRPLAASASCRESVSLSSSSFSVSARRLPPGRKSDILATVACLLMTTLCPVVGALVKVTVPPPVVPSPVTV